MNVENHENMFVYFSLGWIFKVLECKCKNRKWEKIKRNLVPCVTSDESHACNVTYVLDWCHSHNDTSVLNFPFIASTNLGYATR